MKWKIKDQRFIAFFDILGFKDIVDKESHDSVIELLKKFNSNIKTAQDIDSVEVNNNLGFEILEDQTTHISFSDTILLVSKGSTQEDLFKLLMDAWRMFFLSLSMHVPIKGAMSFGTLTIDKDNSIFVGKPLINSYLLHEDMHFLGMILDHEVEKKVKEWKFEQKFPMKFFQNINVKMKYGKIKHTFIFPYNDKWIEYLKGHINRMYLEVSGKPRMYYDNTLEIIDILKDRSEINGNQKN